MEVTLMEYDSNFQNGTQIVESVGEVAELFDPPS